MDRKLRTLPLRRNIAASCLYQELAAIFFGVIEKMDHRETLCEEMEPSENLEPGDQYQDLTCGNDGNDIQFDKKF